MRFVRLRCGCIQQGLAALRRKVNGMRNRGLSAWCARHRGLRLLDVLNAGLSARLSLSGV